LVVDLGAAFWATAIAMFAAADGAPHALGETGVADEAEGLAGIAAGAAGGAASFAFGDAEIAFFMGLDDAITAGEAAVVEAEVEVGIVAVVAFFAGFELSVAALRVGEVFLLVGGVELVVEFFIELLEVALLVRGLLVLLLLILVGELGVLLVLVRLRELSVLRCILLVEVICGVGVRQLDDGAGFVGAAK
jgi:hypothetical protein